MNIKQDGAFDPAELSDEDAARVLRAFIQERVL